MDKLMGFVFRAVDEVGATLNTALVVMGVRRSLAADGTRMIVEPIAGSLSQEVGLALGAPAGETRIRDVVAQAGLTRFRRASETPFNAVFEARP
jgi:hypothetical protein